MRHFSALAGAVALSIMVIPITMRTTEQFLRAVPQTLREGALALGATQWKTVATVVIPAGIRGVLTGTILGVAAWPANGAPAVHQFQQPVLEFGVEPAHGLPSRDDFQLRDFAL